MSKDKKIVNLKHNFSVRPMEDADLEYWFEQLIAYDPSKEDEERTERIAMKVPNVADITSLVDNLVRVKNQEMYQAMMSQSKDIAVLRQILVEKTDISEEEIAEFESDFDTKLQEMQEMLEEQGEE